MENQGKTNEQQVHEGENDWINKVNHLGTHIVAEFF